MTSLQSAQCPDLELPLPWTDVACAPRERVVRPRRASQRAPLPAAQLDLELDERAASTPGHYLRSLDFVGCSVHCFLACSPLPEAPTALSKSEVYVRPHVPVPAAQAAAQAYYEVCKRNFARLAKEAARHAEAAQHEAVAGAAQRHSEGAGASHGGTFG